MHHKVSENWSANDCQGCRQVDEEADLGSEASWPWERCCDVRFASDPDGGAKQSEERDVFWSGWSRTTVTIITTTLSTQQLAPFEDTSATTTRSLPIK